MKRATEILLLITAVYSGLISIFQLSKLARLFQFSRAEYGIGVSYIIPRPIEFIGLIILLNILQLALSAYLGIIGVRLLQGITRGLKVACVLALFSGPIGIAASVCGLIYLANSKSVDI